MTPERTKTLGWAKLVRDGHKDTFEAKHVAGAYIDAEAELAAHRELFKNHTDAVGTFINDLYCIMVDPVGEDVRDVKATCDAIRAAAIRDRDAGLELATLREALEDHSPGTPLGRLKGICEYAEKNCGHTRYSAKSGESAIIEALESFREEAKRLREALNKVAPEDGIDIEHRNGPDTCAWCGSSSRWESTSKQYVENHYEDCAWVLARKALADPPCSKPACNTCGGTKRVAPTVGYAVTYSGRVEANTDVLVYRDADGRVPCPDCQPAKGKQ